MKHDEVMIDYGNRKINAEATSDLLNRLNVDNAISASEFKEVNDDIDADCLAVTILESTFDAIADVNFEGYRYLSVDILEEFKEHLKEVHFNPDIIEKAMDEVYDYLTLYGYKVMGDLTVKNGKWIKEAKFMVEW